MMKSIERAGAINRTHHLSLPVRALLCIFPKLFCWAGEVDKKLCFGWDHLLWDAHSPRRLGGHAIEFSFGDIFDREHT